LVGPETKIAGGFIDLYPDRFLFGTDEVAPADSAAHTKIYKQYSPLWKLRIRKRAGKFDRRITNGSLTRRAVTFGLGKPNTFPHTHQVPR
jgi:hypothetical protein